ncbi:MAG: cytochrome P450, partial [Armatimonadetes bacterium]|nr:cytochrome P450 [Anaerolineae bacterium]
RRAAGSMGDDMLSVLVNLGMSDTAIRDQLMTMLVAGHDTTTAMLAWAFYLLGEHPDAVTQAQAEIDAVLGDSVPDAENTQLLPYLNALINETMRLYPPLHFGSRLAAADLEFNGYPIPKGTRVLYSIFLTHRHPDLWQQPDAFIPERWVSPVKAERPYYAYVPFGGGARMCIGAAFAQVEVRIVLARVLQGFNLAKRGGAAHMHMGVTIEPRPGVPMSVQRR